MKKNTSFFLFPFLLGICLFAFNSSIAQQTNVDEKIQSYNQQIKTSKVDTTIAKAYLELSYLYFQSNIDTVIPLCKQSIKIIKTSLSKNPNSDIQKRLEHWLAENNYMLAYAYYLKGEIKEAIQCNEKAIYLHSGLNNNEALAKTLNNLSVIYTNLGIYEKALECNLKALEIYEHSDKKNELAFAYNNIGNIYFKLEDYEKSNEFTNKGLKIHEKLKSHRGIAQSLNIIGSLYKKKGDTLKAIDYYQKSLETCKKHDNIKGIAVALNNIGIVYKEQSKYDQAIQYLTESLSYLNKINHPFGLSNTLKNLGVIHLEKQNLDQAEFFLNQALKIAQKNNFSDNLKLIATALCELSEKQKNWRNAYNMSLLYQNIQSKIFSDNQEKEKIKNEILFREKSKSEKEKAEQDKLLAIAQEKENHQKNIILLISLGFGLTLIFLFFIYHRLKVTNRQKKIIKVQNDEQKILLQEIHHRVKNNFQIISSLLKLQSNQEDNPAVKKSFNEAINRISSMAIVHDLIYKQDQYAEIDTRDYIVKLNKSIKQSIDIENINIKWCQIKAKNLNIQTLIPLGIIINELITNAVKHAFVSTIKNPTIEFELIQYNENFQLTYKDNGKGTSQIDTDNTFGIELINTLLIQLEGELVFEKNKEWNTSIRITFKEQ